MIEEKCTPDDAIQWGGENEEDFDKRYDHDWEEDQWGYQTCALCGMTDATEDGNPCAAKAVHVSYWIPRAR